MRRRTQWREALTPAGRDGAPQGASTGAAMSVESVESAERVEAGGAPAAPRRYPFTVTVVIPAYEEAHGIAAVVARVREALPEAEILVVDDASSDGTAEAARAAGARVERHPVNRGNGAAVKTGIRRATGEVVLLMDADGQMDPR